MDDSRCFLLLGRTGNGKSSTGNSILDKTAFNTTFGNAMIHDKAVVDGINVEVVDGTGIADTNAFNHKYVSSKIAKITEIIYKLELMFTAIIYVLKYGVPFDGREKDAVEQIKAIFGQDVLKKWGIIVMTFGDDFESDNRENNVTFEKWLRGQTGAIQYLIEECDNRCVLFNNMEVNRRQKFFQRQNLIKEVETIKHGSYTKADFAKEEGGRLLYNQLTFLDNRTSSIGDRIKETIAGINLNARMEKEPEACLDELQSLKQVIDLQRKLLEKMDQGRGLLKYHFKKLKILENVVKCKIGQVTDIMDSLSDLD